MRWNVLHVRSAWPSLYIHFKIEHTLKKAPWDNHYYCWGFREEPLRPRETFPNSVAIWPKSQSPALKTRLLLSCLQAPAHPVHYFYFFFNRPRIFCLLFIPLTLTLLLLMPSWLLTWMECIVFNHQSASILSSNLHAKPLDVRPN